MNYGTIKTYDIANGPGVRVTLFVSGCTNHCPNCFQPETWDFDYGEPFDESTEEYLLRELGRGPVRGLTLLGGDPMEPENQRALVPFLRKYKAAYPAKDLWCFTGFELDRELLVDGSHPRCEVTDEFLSMVDVLVDGRFVQRLKEVGLRFRGSSNPRLIDMNKTREAGKIVLWDDGERRGRM